MSSLGWDVTSVAASHAALSGVLAGIVLVVLPIIAGRNTAKRETYEIQSDLKLLIVAFFCLVLASAIWGGLTGRPSLSDVVAETGSDIETGSLLIARGMSVATSATLLLELGALAMITGILEMVAASEGATSTSIRRFMANTMALLGVLAIYLLSFYALATLVTFFWAQSDIANTAALLLTLASTIGAGIVAFVIRKLGLASSPWLVDLQLWSCFIAASAAVVNYAISVQPNAFIAVRPFQVWDKVGLIALGIGEIAFVVFLLTMFLGLLNSPEPEKSSGTVGRNVTS